MANGTIHMGKVRGYRTPPTAQGTLTRIKDSQTARAGEEVEMDIHISKYMYMHAFIQLSSRVPAHS